LSGFHSVKFVLSIDQASVHARQQFSCCGVKILQFYRKHWLVGAVSAVAIVAALPVASAELTIQIQFEDYTGHEAYFALYLTDLDGRYQRTLWVSGTEHKYQTDMTRWWRYAGRSDETFDAITGASTAGGGRVLVRTELTDKELSSGFQLALDTAVEDQRVVSPDVTAAISSDGQGEKTDGTDYVQFIRYRWQ
jgi:hypothetical protein